VRIFIGFFLLVAGFGMNTFRYKAKLSIDTALYLTSYKLASSILHSMILGRLPSRCGCA